MPAPGTSGKMPDSRNTVTGILITMANTRVSRVRGMTDVYKRQIWHPAFFEQGKMDTYR